MIVKSEQNRIELVTRPVPPQEILTKDSVTVAVDAVVYYKVNFITEKPHVNSNLIKFPVLSFDHR